MNPVASRIEGAAVERRCFGAEPAVLETMLDTAGHATWDLLARRTEPLELKDARAVLMDVADDLRAERV